MSRRNVRARNYQRRRDDIYEREKNVFTRKEESLSPPIVNISATRINIVYMYILFICTRINAHRECSYSGIERPASIYTRLLQNVHTRNTNKA